MGAFCPKFPKKFLELKTMLLHYVGYKSEHIGYNNRKMRYGNLGYQLPGYKNK